MEVQTSFLLSIGSLTGWLFGHQNLSGMMNILAWVSSHPLWSGVIGLLSIAVVWSIIRAIVRGIESISVTILQTPLKLIWQGIKLIFQGLGKGVWFGWKKLTTKSSQETETSGDKEVDGTVETAVQVDVVPIQLQTQQRLAEISMRLVQIQREQTELLQEAAMLMEGNQVEHHLLTPLNGSIQPQDVKN